MVVEPARFTDVIAWASAQRAHGFPVPGLVYKCLLAQIAVSEAVTVRETAEGEPLLIAGCTVIDPGAPGEVFFLARPGGVGRHLVALRRAALRWLEGVAAAHSGDLVCWIGSEQGARLARALGFGPGADGQQWRRR